MQFGAQVFLDMIGERAGSERRGSGRGAHTRQRLFEDASGRAVDVYLLDEHFHRSAVPCPALAAICGRVQNSHTVLFLRFLHLQTLSMHKNHSAILVQTSRLLIDLPLCS
jgi:hypothetical protein